MMRALRAGAAVLLLVLAIVLSVVALVLCLTVVLLPVGLIVAFAAMRLFKTAFKLLLPRTAEVQRGVRKGLRVDELAAVATRVEKSVRRARTRLPERIRSWRRRLSAGRS
jgi:hypothetical protein